ncbi:hypothetical protein [Aliikangiella sp. IMCC44359]|uniref:hypothetical protein n=1 Tax=Aliikangiella sp. IMCC44359 TaxID=3459125 RepID=UPI00403AD994
MKEFKDFTKCVGAMARVLDLNVPHENKIRGLHEYLVVLKNEEGGKNILAVLGTGLITEFELRRFFMEHMATFVLESNSVYSTSKNIFENEELKECFDKCIFGRSAIP